CSKYLNAILDLDPVNHVARVQPGVVLDQLNRALDPHGLQFGPDVATASRANLGGMIGNNSAGARSIVYGKTIDHVRRLHVILANGSEANFGPVTAAEWDRRAVGKSLEGIAYRGVRQVVQANAAEIRRRFPKILRRVSGYNLDVLEDGLQAHAGPCVGLHQIIIGSEGTLAVVTEAELGLIPRPKHRGLLVPHYTSLAAAMDSLAACLEFQPSAVGMLHKILIDLAPAQPPPQDHTAAGAGPAAAPLVG